MAAAPQISSHSPHSMQASASTSRGGAVQSRGQQLLDVTAHWLEAAVGIDGVALEPVGVVEVDQAAPRRGCKGVHGAPLVGGAIGERRVEGDRVPGGEE